MRFYFSFLLICLLIGNSVHAAEPVRVYTLGEDDPGAAIGVETQETLDTLEFPDDNPDNIDIAPLVDLIGFGVYVEGRNGAGSLAIDVDQEAFEAERFDPRDFGSFTALSQGWFKPDPDSEGFQQSLWALGADNGGVAINEDGFYQLVAGGNAGTVTSETKAEFDEWTHLAVLRGGNGANLYVNGALVTTASGFWNGPGTFYLGAGPDGVDPFDGAIDDFQLSGFGDGVFSLANDLTFFEDISLSGIAGDVDQDGLVDQNDYDIWVQNAGSDNGLGEGDIVSLLLGDLDQNGRVNFFDFQIIRAEASANGVMINAVPEPSSLLPIGLSLLLLTACRRSRKRD